MSELLSISHYILGTKVLGPFLRNALWVSGCCFNCDGCLAKEMNKQNPKSISTHELANVFLTTKAEGVTISGGEPFLQSKALSEMIDIIREERDYGVIIYSGYTIDELIQKDDLDINNLLSKTDILIDGRYIKDLDDGKPYRGSSNQRIIPLTDRYSGYISDYYNSQNKRSIEIQIDRNSFYLVGVPSQHGLETWKELTRKVKEDAF